MEAFGTRAALLSVVEDMLDQIHKDRKAASVGQTGLFDTGDTKETSVLDHLPHVPELASHELLGFEKELLGFYLTAHPLEKTLKSMGDTEAMTPISQISEERVGDRIQIVGLIAQVKKIVTKSSGSEMAFIRLEDLTGNIEVVIFPKMYARSARIWVRDACVIITGKVDQKDDRLVILADDVRPLNLANSFTA